MEWKTEVIQIHLAQSYVKPSAFPFGERLRMDFIFNSIARRGYVTPSMQSELSGISNLGDDIASQLNDDFSSEKFGSF